MRAGVCEAHADFQSFTKEARECLSNGGFKECLRGLEHYFGGETYSLKSLFRDERKRIVTQIVDNTLADIALYAHAVAVYGRERHLLRDAGGG